MNAKSELYLSAVNPALAAKIRTLAEMLSTEGITVIVSAGFRTWMEQDALYAEGRTAPGKAVTDAPGGYSWHNFGCAVDCEPEVIDGVIDWNAEHPQWKRMASVGVSLGLASGANWIRIKDAPHFQLTGRFPVTPNAEVRQIYQNEGVEAVWQEVNKI